LSRKEAENCAAVFHAVAEVDRPQPGGAGCGRFFPGLSGMVFVRGEDSLSQNLIKICLVKYDNSVMIALDL